VDYFPDPKLSGIHVRALDLLRTAPDGSGGQVEIRQYRKPGGGIVYNVSQYSNSGGWTSANTDLPTARLIAEILALMNNAELLRCVECDAAEEDPR
jgi:hypothetical protein